MLHNMPHILALMPGHWEWMVVLVVAVLIFGRRLPEIARGLGKSITEFKKGIKEAEKDVTSGLNEADHIAENSGKTPQIDVNQD